jgi:phosphomannomutase/phosphoglucomutase
MLDPTIFREYDIRGIADRDLTSDGVRELGQAVGTYLIRRGGSKVNLGRDVRLSGPRLHDALLEGLLSTGCHVTDLGTVPTPLVYFSVYHLNSDGAVQITGSHNPADYNGFKVAHGGATIYGEEIQKLRRLIETGDFEKGTGTLRSEDLLQAYVDSTGSAGSRSRSTAATVPPVLSWTFFWNA